jgi:hypothetical protein
MKCECILAGYCERHATNKTDRMVELCQTNVAYWEAWESGRLQDVSKNCVPPSKKPVGPGTELKLLLASRGYTVRMKGCGCKDRIRKMDAWGVEGCRKRRQEIIEWLEESAKNAGWLERIVVTTPLVKDLARKKIYDLVNEAIDRAEVELQRSQSRNTMS